MKKKAWLEEGNDQVHYSEMLLQKNIIIVLFVAYLFILSRGNAVEYFDLYTPGELDRLRGHSLENDELRSHGPSTNDRNRSGLVSSENSEPVGRYSSTESPVLLQLPLLVVFVVIALAVLIATVSCIVHVVHRRKRRNLRNDLAMTPEDTELSSSALGTDPFERVSRRGSFDIPLPCARDFDKQTSQLKPYISVTSPTGSTTKLFEDETQSRFVKVNLASGKDRRKPYHR